MPLNMVSMAIYVTLEGKIPRTPISFSKKFSFLITLLAFIGFTMFLD